MLHAMDSELDHTTNDPGVGNTSGAAEILSAEVNSPPEDHGEPRSLGNDGEAELFNGFTQGTDFEAAHGPTSAASSPFAGSLDSPAVVPETEPSTNASPKDGMTTQEDGQGEKADASPPPGRSERVSDTAAVCSDGPVPELEAHHSSTPSAPSVSEVTEEEHRQEPTSCPSSPALSDLPTTMYPATPPTTMYPETPPPERSPSAAPTQPSCPGHESSSPSTEAVTVTEFGASCQVQVRFVHQYLGEVTFKRPQNKLIGRIMQRACNRFNIDPLRCRFLLDDGTRVCPESSIESLDSYIHLNLIKIDIFQEQTGGGVSRSYVRWRTMLDQQRRGAVVRKRNRPSSWRALAGI